MMVYVVLFLVNFLINYVIATFMNNVAIQKGQENSHAFIITLLFGFVGCLYVVALPDIIQRKQAEDILAVLLKMKGDKE
ncbi:MAG: hypothetical protein K2J60_10695 [Acetatifactor sp.]|nr:hypothetical protein [Acetatifactor sp.]